MNASGIKQRYFEIIFRIASSLSCSWHKLAAMEVNSTLFTDEPEITTDPEDTINTYGSYKYVFIPIQLIQIIVTIVSNGVLLMMIGRSFRSCTSLNIFLLSISIFNLLTIVNQISLVVFNFQSQTTYFPHQLCHLITIIKTSATIGTVLLHLFISHHRFKIAKRPLTWQSTRKQAWLLGIVIWAIACAVAVFECILHFNNGDRRTLQSCLWPGVSQCSNMLSLYTQLLTLACLSIISGITCYFYGKTAKELKENELEKELRLRSSALVSSRSGKRKLTSPERAVVSLFTIFTIHCITQLPTYIYGIIVSSMSLSKHDSETADEEENTAIATIGSMPILLLLATISFLTTCSPLVLACINKKFKQHIKSILQFICGSEDHINEEKFLHQVQAKFPAEPTPSSPQSPVHPSTPIPKNVEVFYGHSKRSKFYVRSKKSNYITSGPHLTAPGATDSSRPERVSESSLHVSRNVRPSRISTNSATVGLTAVSAGLALSAPGHRIMIDNFFKPDGDEEIVEELYRTLNYM